MTAADLVDLYSGLVARGVRLWVDGGWGVDALLGRQTRPHRDLDTMAAFDDLPALTGFLGGRGFSLKEIWEENRWTPCPSPPALIGRRHPAAEAAAETATAFVLEDRSGRELDFHVVRFDERGRGTPAWDSDLVFPPDAFAGLGVVGGTRVRCLSAETQMRAHTGYALKESDVRDLRLLHDRFGIAYPEEVAHLFPAR